MHMSAPMYGMPVCPADSNQDTRLAAAEAGDAVDHDRTAIDSSETAADANASAATAPNRATKHTRAAPASDRESAASDASDLASDLEAPPEVAVHDTVPPLSEAQQPTSQQDTSSSSVSRLSPVYSRQSTGGSSGWTSDFERSAAPMESSGLGDAGTSTLPVTQSLSYRCGKALCGGWSGQGLRVMYGWDICQAPCNFTPALCCRDPQKEVVLRVECASDREVRVSVASL